MDTDSRPGEIRFRIGSIPVIIQPYFWLTAVILSGGWFNAEPRPWPIFTFILACFLSILLHELGHAWMGKLFGARYIHIVLTGLGGFASGANTNPHWWQRILVTLAGPGIQLVLAGLLHFLLFETAVFSNENQVVTLFALQLYTISLFWALINLIPIYPLDGGQVALEILQKATPSQSEKLSALLSIALCIGLLYYIYNHQQSMFNMILVAMLAVQNLERLQRASARPDDDSRWRE